MPTPANPKNEYRCDACGRHFARTEDLEQHRTECAAAKRTGSGDRQTNADTLEEGTDRDWVSTP